jgi:site-specific DNA recombinase
MKAILVARVSTEEQREANNSLPAQIHRMEEYCHRYGYEIIESYSFDESAYKDKRSEFDKIIARIDSINEKVAVCFDKVDRFSRDIFDKRVPVLYNKALNDTIELHFVSDGQVINSSMGAWDKFAFGMKLWLSKYYSDAISDNVKRTFREKRSRWESTWPAKLWYINTIDENGKNTVVPDPERKHLITRLFELYGTWNYSMESIWVEMQKMGLRSKKWFNVWRSTIENILKDPFYHGVAYSKKYKTSSNHKYTKLISKELFDRCQEVRKWKLGRPEKAVVNEEFIFWWVLKCNRCGCSISPEVKVKKSWKRFIYYSCTNGKHICKRDYVNENILLESLFPILSKISIISPEAQSFILSEMRASEESEVTFNKAQLKRIEREIEKIKVAEENLIKNYCNPDSRITSEMYDKIHQEYEDQLSRLTHEKQKYSEWKSEYELSIDTIFSLARRSKEIFESSEVWEKKMLLRFLLQNPVLDERNPIFNLESPFDILLTEGDIKQKSQIWSEISDEMCKWLPE